MYRITMVYESSCTCYHLLIFIYHLSFDRLWTTLRKKRPCMPRKGSKPHDLEPPWMYRFHMRAVPQEKLESAKRRLESLTGQPVKDGIP